MNSHISQWSCGLHPIFWSYHEYRHYHIYGMDLKLWCPTLSGGLFGFCKRFSTSTETQGSGNLQAHWLVYAHGMPTTTTRFIKLVRYPNSPFMNHFIANQTTFLQMKVPISKGAIYLDWDGLTKCWSYLFLFSKGLSTTQVLILQQFAQHVKLVSLMNIYWKKQLSN
jgi:hypothetical protein